LATEEEHVAVVIHILEVGLKGICAALAGRSRIRGIMVEQWVPGKCENSSETSIAWLVKVKRRAEEVRHVAIFDQVGASQKKQATYKGNGIVQGVAANCGGKQVPEDTIGIVFTQVEWSGEIEAMGTTIPGDFQEVRVEILVVGSAEVLGKLGKAFCKLIGFLEWLNSATC
jgi:hypothetical protein